MPGDQINMSENAHFMIHAASGIVWGNADAVRQYLKLLDNADELIRLTYAARTGLSDDELSEMMDHDNWMTAQEAFDSGFVDQLDPVKSVKPHVTPDDEPEPDAQQRPGSCELKRLAAMASNLLSLAAMVRPANSTTPTGSSPAPGTKKEPKMNPKLRAKCIAAGMSGND